ncbi:cytochrome P450 4C1 isoform X1 [Acyrthosiphon pisum]|uniref:Cytochrome P450 n=2 Tax=Acyrthosiphon pisum TaxID=7029 RepID=A0A8R2JST3_ACYPI|nr:cytochrome P450 4C1 isoform X1 [Acyrthosiphon pisum]
MTIILILSLFLIFIILILIFTTCFCARKSKEHYRLCAKLPSMPRGYLTDLKLSHKLSTLKPKDVLPFLSSILKQHGSLVHIHLLGHSYVLLNDPNDIKVLLSSPQHINKGPEYGLLKPWLNKGLLTSGSQKWQMRRKLLTYTFHFKILETYISSFNKHAQCLTKKLENMASNNQRVSIYTHMTLCALDLVCDTIMGTELRSQEGKSLEYVEAINTVTDITIKRIFKFWLWNGSIFNLSQIGRDFNKSLKILHTFTENVIKEKRAKLESVNCLETEELSFGKKRVESFLDLLIGISKQNPEKMTDMDIREEVDTFLFEGHDTSSTAMTMAFIQLGLNQDIQNSVREELYSIFGDSDREATMADLKSMTYLDRVIKETIRLYPSVPSVTRMLRQHLHIKEYDIPPQTVVVVVPYLLHREEKHFPNPLTFDPDRFLPEHSINRHPYAFIPFSAGPRNCIGQKFAMYQMKTIISTVIRKMKIETLGSQDDIKISAQLILRPESLPDIKLTKIK